MEHTFYDSKGQKLVYNLDKEKSIAGNSGNIFLLGNDRCIKVYHNTGITDRDTAVADVVAFKRLMEVDSAGFYKILRLLFDKRGYIMASESMYYPFKYDDPLLLPMDYFLNSLNNLYDAVLKISDKQVRMNDLHSGNLALYSLGIVIIDGDDYVIDTSKGLFRINKKILYLALRELFSLAVSTFHGELDFDTRQKYCSLIEQLFCFDDDPSFIGSKVKTYKRPIDYLHSKINK